MTQQSKFDYLVKTLDEIKPVIQATHDQTIKTNGRVNRLEDWRDEQNITVKGLVRINNMLTGGLALWTFVSAAFVTFAIFSMDNYVKNKQTETKNEAVTEVMAQINNQFELKDVTIK